MRGDEEELEAVVRRHGGVLSVAEARAAGVTKAALEWGRKTSRLRLLRRGVYTTAKIWEDASPARRHRLKVLAQQRVHPELVASQVSAAVLLGLPTPDGPPAEPQFTVARAGQRHGARGRRAGSIARRAWLAESEVATFRSGVRVTSRLRTVIDCAREWEPAWGLAVADAAIQRWQLDAVQLRAAVDDRPLGPGSRTARWVAEHARAKVESPLESLARAVVVQAGLPEPTPQVWVHTRAGWFRVDLLDETSRVIIEADGKLKYTEPSQLWQEKRREDALREAGAEVVRFTMSDHWHPQAWLTVYRSARERGMHRLGR